MQYSGNKLKLEKDPSFKFEFNDGTPNMQAITAGQYPHVLDDKMYYETADPRQVRHVVWNGKEYTYPEENDVILEKSGACHNFRTFIDENPNTTTKYKAIGGFDMHKNHPDLSDCEFSKNLEDVSYPGTLGRPRIGFKEDCNHPRHANGLYIFSSDDGIKWDNYSKKPVFSYRTETKSHPHTLSFDWMPSVVWNGEEYRVFIRSNIKLRVRNIFTSTSKDLLDWSTPELVNFPNFDMQRSNYYFFDCYYINNKYVAFAPHFKHWNDDGPGPNPRFNECHTSVMTSEDGVNWKEVDRILIPDRCGHLSYPHVTSVRKEGSQYAFYVNENFLKTPCSGFFSKFNVKEENLLSCIS